MTTRIVAELSANHNGSLERALELVDHAAAAGADAVKIQTWTPGKMVLDQNHVLRTGPWAGRNLAQLYDQAHTPEEWHAPIFERAAARGIECFSSVFDYQALELLERLGCPRYKIASFELVDTPLIRAVASTKKPIILSTGMATLPEIENAFQNAMEGGARDITLLKCTSAYPADPKDVNLATMRHMVGRFPTAHCSIGLSDHTQGIAAAVVAASMGAAMIEKHLKMAGEAGLDADFSLDPAALAMLVYEVKRAAQVMGEVHYGPRTAEQPQVELRRSLYFARDMAAGETPGMTGLATARPARGIAPKFLTRCSGMKLAQSVRRGQPVLWDQFHDTKTTQPAEPIA